jgi:hypothetical protein
VGYLRWDAGQVKCCEKQVVQQEAEMPSILNPEGTSTGEVCIPNISTAERRRRLISGIVALVIGLAVSVALMLTGANHWWRLLLFLPFAGAASGFFQWHDKTCVGLAARQSRKLGEQAEKIEDAAELAQVRRQASRVQLKSLAAGIGLMLITLVLP